MQLVLTDFWVKFIYTTLKNCFLTIIKAIKSYRTISSILNVSIFHLSIGNYNTFKYFRKSNFYDNRQIVFRIFKKTFRKFGKKIFNFQAFFLENKMIFPKFFHKISFFTQLVPKFGNFSARDHPFFAVSTPEY